MLLELFYPDHEIDSAYSIDYAALYKDGKRAVIFDVDNTLVPHGAPADDRAKKLFSMLHGLGYHTLLLSNNKEPRVKPFSNAVGSTYIYKAGKPGRAGYEKAMEKLGSTLSCQAHPPEGRDPDRPQTPPGTDCSLFLSSKKIAIACHNTSFRHWAESKSGYIRPWRQ